MLPESFVTKFNLNVTDKLKANERITLTFTKARILKSSEEVKVLADFLRKCPSVEGLSLEYTEIKESDYPILAEAITKANNVKFLNFVWHRHMTERGWESLMKTLYSKQNLSSLKINLNKSVVAWEALSLALPKCALSELSIQNGIFPTETLKDFAGLLPGWVKLTALELINCEVDDIGLQRLTSKLAQCVALHNLTLSYNKIGGEGVKALSVILPQSFIRHLNLEGNVIDLNGLRWVLTVLPKCINLLRLNVASNSIFLQSSYKISDFLKKSPHFLSINLQKNPIKKEIMRSLLTDILNLCRGLTEIEFEGLKLGNKDKKAFALTRNNNKQRNDSLFDAVENDNRDLTTHYLKEGASLWCRSHDGLENTLLHICIDKHYLEMALFLIDKAPQLLFATNSNNTTPLPTTNSQEALKYIESKFNERMMNAVKKNDFSLIKYCSELDVPLDSALFYAVETNNLELLEFCYKLKKSSLTCISKDGQSNTLLHSSVAKNHWKIARFLVVNNSLLLTYINSNDETPLKLPSNNMVSFIKPPYKGLGFQGAEHRALAKEALDYIDKKLAQPHNVESTPGPSSLPYRFNIHFLNIILVSQSLQPEWRYPFLNLSLEYYWVKEALVKSTLVFGSIRIYITLL